MPGENIQDWSTTAANNATADSSIGWAEGMARASVNNSARSMMAAHAKDRNLRNGSITTGGTTNAQTFSSGLSYTSVPTGLIVKLKIGSGLNNTTSATLNMDSIGAVTIKNEVGVDLSSGALIDGTYADFRYDGTNWILLGTAPGSLRVSDGTAATPSIAFGNDADTGMFRNSDNQIGFAAGGTSSLVVSSTTVTIAGDLSVAGLAASGNVNLGNASTDVHDVHGSFYQHSVAGISVAGTNSGSLFQGGTAGYVMAVHNTAASTAAGAILFVDSDSAAVGSITINSTANTTTYNTLSDGRLKPGRRAINSGAAIDALNPVNHNWSHAPDVWQHGLIAQEANEVYPVPVTPGRSNPGDPDFMPWQIDYSKYVPLLLAEVKSLRKRIKALEG